jgi:hypothetical protein
MILASVFLAGAFAAVQPPTSIRAEVDGLLATLERSDCQFYRNGTWHDGHEAQAHLRMKYEYLVRKGLLQRTEDFIEGAGTKSSLSGEPYLVRCPSQSQAPQPSAAWLNQRVRERRMVHQDTRP